MFTRMMDTARTEGTRSGLMFGAVRRSSEVVKVEADHVAVVGCEEVLHR